MHSRSNGAAERRSGILPERLTGSDEWGECHLNSLSHHPGQSLAGKRAPVHEANPESRPVFCRLNPLASNVRSKIIARLRSASQHLMEF